MSNGFGNFKRKVTRRRTVLGLLSIALVIVLVAAACGEDATPTPVPATATSAPATATSAPATATSVPPTATSEPTTQIRPKSEWTAENPATLAEIEAELEKYRGSSFTESGWGGAWQAAIRQGVMEKFTAKFGITIIEDSPIELAKMQAMTRTGNVTWDVVDFGTRWAYTLGDEGLETLNPAMHGYKAGWPEVAVTPWTGGAGVMWSTGIAYSLDSFPNHVGAPKSWADFFDVEGVPGRRSLGDRPNENIYFAQMALHPELFDNTQGFQKLSSAQLDESFEKLREIRSDLTLFWKTGTDCPQLLLSGELDMCSAWNGRIWNAQQEPGGSSLYYCYECGHINQTSVFAILKGAPNKEVAELYLAWIGFPEIGFEISKYITYGPIHADALPFVQTLPQNLIDALPTSPIALEKMLVIDEVWLGTNLSAGENLVERWTAFTQGTE